MSTDSQQRRNSFRFSFSEDSERGRAIVGIGRSEYEARVVNESAGGMQLAFDRAPTVRYGDPCDVCTIVGIQHMVVVWTVYSGNECRWGLRRILSPDDRDREIRLIRQKVADQINGPRQPVGTAERTLALLGALLLIIAVFTYTFGEAKIKRIARDGWSKLSDPQSFLQQFAQSISIFEPEEDEAEERTAQNL